MILQQKQKFTWPKLRPLQRAEEHFGNKWETNEHCLERQSFTFYYLQQGWMAMMILLLLLLTSVHGFGFPPPCSPPPPASHPSSSSQSSFCSFVYPARLSFVCRHGRTVGGGRGTENLNAAKKQQNQVIIHQLKCQEGRNAMQHATSKQGTVFFFLIFRVDLVTARLPI